MSIFSFEKKRDSVRVQLFLNILGLEEEAPTLNYLNKLIKNHQEKIPFESFTRIVDFHSCEGKLPSIEKYIDRLTDGHGGVCWTLARGFAWLLHQLQFDVSYQYMDPGHLCLQVVLDGKKYYADIGYAAPIFNAPLIMSTFEIKESHERFIYEVRGNEIVIKRDPGPTKIMRLGIYSPEIIEKYFHERNIWGESRFLSTLFIIKYINGKYVKLNGDNFIDFRSGKEEIKSITDNDIPDILKTVFLIDPIYFQQAKSLLSKKK